MRPELTMEQIRLLAVFAFILLFADKPVLGELVRAILGDSVPLTANNNCTGSEDFKLTTDDNREVVARRVNGVWTPEKKYSGRIEHHSPSSVNFTNLNYKDSGHYEFDCNGHFTTVQLTVLEPRNITVTEGETVELPCYFLTAEQVKWFKNEKEIIWETHFHGRAFLPTDGHMTGKFSPILNRVQLDDQGDFFCYEADKDGKTRGDPKVVRMRVKETHPEQTTSTPSPTTTQGPKGGNDMEPWAIASVAANVLLVIVVAVLSCKLWRNSRRSNVSSGQGGGGGPSADVEMTPLTNPAGSQVNNGHQSLNHNGY